MKVLTISILLLFFGLTNAQHYSILGGAENYKSNNYIVNWTLGNTISENANIKSLNVTQGALFNTYRLYYEEKTDLKITCFPNPFHSYFFLEIESNTPEQYTWVIVSGNGKRIKKESVQHSLTKIDISQLDAQLYFLYLYDKNNKKAASAKLIKK